jgi:uncharacterized Fe-S cluster-containing MiaB family protein
MESSHLSHEIKLTDEYMFKGQESIDEWTKKIEEVAIGIALATDARGLRLFVNEGPMVLEFMKACEEIKKNMNVSDGPCGFIPGPSRED